MVDLSDEELLMLEQLCYLTDEVGEEGFNSNYNYNEEDSKLDKDNKHYRPIDEYSNRTVKDYLSQIDVSRLEKLDQNEGNLHNTHIGTNEWVQTIKYIQNSDKLNSLYISNVKNKNNANNNPILQAICFTEDKKSDEAIVTFRGTASSLMEWGDNVKGIATEETLAQGEALDYIEELPYSNLTVVGHSKGANKAQYVALMSEKVQRAVSFDGQGFSKKFIESHIDEIAKNANKISYHAVATDYVHELMMYVPGVKINTYKAFGITSPDQHHSPNTFFATDENGNLIIKDGKPVFEPESEPQSITNLHNFTLFIMNTANDQDLKRISDYLADVLDVAFGGRDDKSLQEVLLSDTDTLAIIMGYLVKFADTYDLGSDDVNELLTALCADDVNKVLFSGLSIGGKDINLGVIIDLLRNQFTDGEEDFIIQKLLGLFTKRIGLGVDGEEFWRKIERTYQNIPNISRKDGIAELAIVAETIRDFSYGAYEAIIDIINRINDNTSYNIKKWRNFSSEDWFDDLFIDNFVMGISSYSSDIEKINTKSRRELERIFDIEYDISSTYAKKLRRSTGDLSVISSKLKIIIGN